MNGVTAPIFNTIFGRNNTKVFFPKVDSSLREIEPELLSRLKRYVTYVAIAHCKYGFEQWKCGRCQKESLTSNTEFIKTFQGPALGAFGYVALKKEFKEIYVNFNGASSPMHWKLMQNEFNLVVFPTSKSFKDSYKFKKEVKVHSGFLKLFNDVYPLVLERIQMALESCSDCQLVITGHSMGGIFLGMLAIRLRNDNLGIANPILASFGSPRVGNSVFAMVVPKVCKEAYRIVHNSDNVAKIPPRILGYRHYATEIWIADQYIGPGKPQIPVAFKDPVGSDFKNILPKTFICDRKSRISKEDKRCLNSTPLHLGLRIIKNPAQALQIIPTADEKKLEIDPEKIVNPEVNFKKWIDYHLHQSSFPNFYMHSTFWGIYSTSFSKFGFCLSQPEYLKLKEMNLLNDHSTH